MLQGAQRTATYNRTPTNTAEESSRPRIGGIRKLSTTIWPFANRLHRGRVDFAISSDSQPQDDSEENHDPTNGVLNSRNTFPVSSQLATNPPEVQSPSSAVLNLQSIFGDMEYESTMDGQTSSDYWPMLKLWNLKALKFHVSFLHARTFLKGISFKNILATFWRGFYSKRKEFAPQGANSFLLE